LGPILKFVIEQDFYLSVCWTVYNVTTLFNFIILTNISFDINIIILVGGSKMSIEMSNIFFLHQWNHLTGIKQKTKSFCCWSFKQNDICFQFLLFFTREALFVKTRQFVWFVKIYPSWLCTVMRSLNLKVRICQYS